MPGPARRRGGSQNLLPQGRIPWAGEWPDLSPVTIVRLDRWVAFPLEAGDLPADHAAAGFLAGYAAPHGVGESPDAAYLDLARHLRAGRDRRR